MLVELGRASLETRTYLISGSTDDGQPFRKVARVCTNNTSQVSGFVNQYTSSTEYSGSISLVTVVDACPAP